MVMGSPGPDTRNDCPEEYQKQSTQQKNPELLVFGVFISAVSIICFVLVTSFHVYPVYMA
jgi:hypothetical protein